MTSPAPSVGPSASAGIGYVALGDSYTIGTSVGESERWPKQLVAQLAGTPDLRLVANLGFNGYSSADLIEDELPRLHDLRPDFVTVLIGVNAVIRGATPDEYRANVADILDTLTADLPADRIVVVSMPDYTRTRYGSAFGDPAQQRAAIAEFNAIMREAATSRGIAFVDIGPVADLVGTEPGLLADDGLHPSGVQYSRWVELIAPVVTDLFAR